MYNYIPLPTNMRDFSAVVTLRIEEGSAGFGVYIMLLSILRDMPNYRVSDNAKRLAFVLNESDIELVQRVCHNYGLFDFDDDGLLFSPWLIEQMEAYDSKKKKLQEAGRRGAAKRFNTPDKSDGQAIATPSVEDGQAIAYNITQHNITKHNITQPTQAMAEDWKEICLNPGPKLDDELVEAICKTDPEGHAGGYIAQVCKHYGIGTRVMDYLMQATDAADIKNPTYLAFVALVKRIQAEKYVPRYPANFFLSKLAKS